MEGGKRGKRKKKGKRGKKEEKRREKGKKKGEEEGIGEKKEGSSFHAGVYQTHTSTLVLKYFGCSICNGEGNSMRNKDIKVVAVSFVSWLHLPFARLPGSSPSALFQMLLE